MESRKTIKDELNELAPGLAQINPVTPYQVPQAYFESLPKTILSIVKEEISTVIPDSKQNPYQLPPNYFENLPETILNKVKAMDSGSASEEMELLSPLLSKLDKKAPFSVPDGYFDELPANVADGAKAIDLVNQELENLSPLMSELKGKHVYEVPQGYFEKLPVELLKKTKQQQVAKVISIGFGRKMIRYAAAAVIAGLMFVAGWQMYNKPSQPDATVVVKTLSEEEIENYLNEESTNAVTPVLASNDDISTEDMKDMLADVSDEELQQYVEQSVTVNNSLTN